jgi:undecaprenyl-phosphate galactose phosphotransferase
MRVRTLFVSNHFNKVFFVFFSLLTDFFMLFLLLNFSFIARKYFLPLFFAKTIPFDHKLTSYLWLIFVHLFIVFLRGGYFKRFTFWDEIKFLWQSTFLTTVLVISLLFITKHTESFSRFITLLWIILCFLFYPFFRIKIKQILLKLGLNRERILVIGLNDNAIKFIKALKNDPNLGYDIAGILDDKSDQVEIENIKIYKYEDSIDRYLKLFDIQTIAVSDSVWIDEKFLPNSAKLSNKLKTIFYIPHIKKLPVIGMELRYFLQEDVFALELKNNLANPLNYFLKRTFDYFLTIILLPFVLPLCALIALMIRLSSPGPIIFVQERVGKGGKPFRLYKFRTMYVDAEERLKELLKNNPEAKAEWEEKYKLTNDPRVTPIGRILRKTSLDELPQIFNILKGEMSLIGPRPVTKEELEKYYRENAELYYLVPPGLTGLWQVSGRNKLSYEERVNLDCWYVRNWSLWLDFVILLKTPKVILTREGAF